MRHSTPRVPKPAYPWYRVRFKTTPISAAVLGLENDATAIPGIIKRNRPKADRALKAMAKLNPWLEIKDGPDSEWRKL